MFLFRIQFYIALYINTRVLILGSCLNQPSGVDQGDISDKFSIICKKLSFSIVYNTKNSPHVQLIGHRETVVNHKTGQLLEQARQRVYGSVEPIVDHFVMAFLKHKSKVTQSW